MEFIKELSTFSAATICEAMGNKGYLPSGIKPIASNMKICGPAYTVQTMPRDNVLLHRAYAYAKAGDVLIANCSGFYEAGYWGDLMSLGAKTKGINGLVIDACVRDADDIEAMEFPVFSRGLCIRGTSKSWRWDTQRTHCNWRSINQSGGHRCGRTVMALWLCLLKR